MFDVPPPASISRRRLIGASAAAAAGLFTGALAGSSAAQAAGDGYGPAGTSPDSINWFDTANETQVLAGQREFRAALARASIPHEWREVPGGHVFRHDLFVQDLNGMLGRLRRAG